MKNEVTILNQSIAPAIIFGGKNKDGKDPLEELLIKFEEHARNQNAADLITTPKGRKEIASLAHQIARTKVALDDMGKELNEEKRKSIDAVNADRNRAKDRLQALQDEIRKPLTDFENKEKERVAEHEKAISMINELSTTPIESDDISLVSEQIKSLEDLSSRDWEEFKDQATKLCKEALERLNGWVIDCKKRIEEKAELERLRKEKEEREAKEREERIAREAAEAARLKAEAKAKAEAEAAEAAAKAEREAIEQKAKEAREAAEAKRLEAERKAQEDRNEAARIQEETEKRARAAEKAAEDAAENERKRIANEQEQNRIAAEKRELDKKHKAKINNEALSAFVKSGLSEKDGKKAVESIAKKLINHVTISY